MRTSSCRAGERASPADRVEQALAAGLRAGRACAPSENKTLSQRTGTCGQPSHWRSRTRAFPSRNALARVQHGLANAGNAPLAVARTGRAHLSQDASPQRVDGVLLGELLPVGRRGRRTTRQGRGRARAREIFSVDGAAVIGEAFHWLSASMEPTMKGSGADSEITRGSGGGPLVVVGGLEFRAAHWQRRARRWVGGCAWKGLAAAAAVVVWRGAGLALSSAQGNAP